MTYTFIFVTLHFGDSLTGYQSTFILVTSAVQVQRTDNGPQSAPLLSMVASNAETVDHQLTIHSPLNEMLWINKESKSR